MAINRFCLLWLCCLSPVFWASAQYSYRHYTLRDGLAQGSSAYIMQDSRRFLWFSVQGGLNRFDGSTFVFYPNGKRGLRGGFISGLVEAPNGDLWLGTEEGLNRYNRQTDSFTAIESAGPQAPAAAHVFDADSLAVWFIADALGLARYEYATKRITILLPGVQTSKGFEKDYVFHDRAAHLIWLMLPQGLMAFDYRTGKKQWYFTSRPGDPMRYPTRFSAFRWDARRQLFWLTNSGELIAFSPHTQRASFYKSPVDLSTYLAYGIHLDARQQLWINTGGAGILLFDIHRRQFTRNLRHQPQNPQSLAIDEVGSLYIDREGTTWANVDPIGLDRLTVDQTGIQTYTANAYELYPLAANTIRGVAEAPDGAIWIGSMSGGANRLDLKTRQVRRFVITGKSGSLPGGGINGFCFDKQGRTWVATWQGLAGYNPATDKFTLLAAPSNDPESASVQGFFLEPQGTILVATYAGIFRFNTARKNFTPVGEGGRRLLGSFWHDSVNHRLYVGRRQAGFDVYDYRNGKLRWLYNERLNGQNALCFHYDTKQQALWVGSSDLLQYDPAKQRIIRHVSLGDDIRPVYAIVPDLAGVWWIPTNQGLYRYNPETGMARPFRAVNPQEYNSLAALKTRSGSLFFGGNEGVVHIAPNQLTSRFNPITVGLSSILINDRPIALAANELDTLSLPTSQRTLTVRYGAIDFVSEGKNHYQYRLLGYDPAWIDAGNSMVARYANLPPGAYTFEVKAANADGQWTARPRRLTVLVATPFWQTGWFIALVIVLGGALLYGLFRWVLARRLQVQRGRFALMLQAQQQERTRLARELHDHIGPDLAVLKLRLELAADDALLPKDTQQLSEFSADLDHILGDLRNVSHALLPADLQANSLVNSLESFINQLSDMPDQPEINFVYNLANDVPQVLQQPVYQIAKELVHNALKHADASVIDVELNQQQGSVQLTVTDDGRGYDPAMARKLSNGIGLRNLEATVSMLNGELVIHPRPLRGTVHRIRFPA